MKVDQMTSPSPIGTVASALASLRGAHPALLDDVSRGDRVLWVGSGVSRNQVPGLEPLLRKALTFLQTNDTGAADDPHKRGLEGILGDYLPPELASYRRDPAGWSVPADLSDLVTSYSEILSVGIAGQEQDYLLWVAIDVRETYGSPAIEPGPEHWLISILIHEGVVSEIVTTNWDGLIERATKVSTGSGQPAALGIFMSNESFRTARGRCSLYKAHGCAVLAREDEVYRQYLVAQTADIAIWLSNPIYDGMVERLRALARTRKSLMLGLSVQDYNLMAQIAGASRDLPWNWDPNDPAYIFAEPAIQPSQRSVLQTVYREQYPPNRDAIASLSAAGMYSGLLLAALTLHVLIEKLRIGIDCAPVFAGSANVIESLCKGLERVESYLAEDAGGDIDRLVVLIRRGISSLVCRFFDPGTELVDDEYMPFYGNSLKAGVDEQFRQLDLPALSVAVGLLGLGYARNHWRLVIGTGGSLERGVIQLMSPHLPASSSPKVVITRDWRSTNALMATDLWATDPGELVVIQATGDQPAAMTRGVGGGIGSGRSRRRSRRQIWLSDLEPHVGSADALLGAFRAEVSV